MKHYLSAALLLACSFILSGPGFAQQPTEDAEGVTVERQVDKGLVLVKIASQDGKVAWEDVLRALLRLGHMEDDALKDKFPSGALDLQRPHSSYFLTVINLAIPNIRMRIVAESEGTPAHLLVTINEDAIEERKRRLKKTIRDRITGGEMRKGVYGLRLTKGELKDDPTQPVVVIVHGFNSSRERFEPLAEAIHRSGFASGTYSYPDDQPIVDSANQLSLDLKKIASQYPHRSIYLVTHSMGGLISRCVIEQPELDPGNVTKLIMIAPPTHGSLLAHFAFGGDILDHAAGDFMQDDVTRFYAAVEDGLSEAKDDLKPRSAFLRELNARSRNPEVGYSIFLGTGGHLNRGQVDRLRNGLRSASVRSTTVGLFAPYLDEMLGDMDEIIDGKGDGVVAVKRGRLEGVSDIVSADFTHLGVLQTPGSFQEDEVFQGVVQRLKNR